MYTRKGVCYVHIYTSGRECMAGHTPVEDAWLNMATQTNPNDQQNNLLKIMKPP